MLECRTRCRSFQCQFVHRRRSCLSSEKRERRRRETAPLNIQNFVREFDCHNYYSIERHRWRAMRCANRKCRIFTIIAMQYGVDYLLCRSRVDVDLSASAIENAIERELAIFDCQRLMVIINLQRRTVEMVRNNRLLKRYQSYRVMTQLQSDHSLTSYNVADCDHNHSNADCKCDCQYERLSTRLWSILADVNVAYSIASSITYSTRATRACESINKIAHLHTNVVLFDLQQRSTSNGDLNVLLHAVHFHFVLF